jgi:hypothetical protein
MNAEPKKGTLSDSVILVAVIVFVAWGVLLAVAICPTYKRVWQRASCTLLSAGGTEPGTYDSNIEEQGSIGNRR